MTYIIKRGTADLVSVSPRGWQSKQAMGENIADMTFTLHTPVVFKKGDWVVIYGERYEINILPTYIKKSESEFEYSVQLEHEFYRLREVAMLGYDSTNKLTEPVHSISSDAYGHMIVLLANANRVSSGWTLGVVQASEIRNIEYSANEDNLLAVLNRLASEFETEYWIENKTIHLAKRTGSMNRTLGYGKGKGFLSVKRTNKDNSFIKTRLYVEGGETNIESGYRSGKKALQLPIATPYIQDSAKVQEYGTIEAYVQFPEIFPRRTGTVTSVDSTNPNVFFDSAIDFNVNDYLTETDATVVFKSGLLAGYELTISSFDNATKKFVFNSSESEKDFQVPSENIRPAVGDTYVVVNIFMPPPYTTNAENELKAAGLDAYNKISDPNFNDKFEVVCDRIFFKSNSFVPTLGYTINLFEANPSINVNKRVSVIKRSLENAWDFELELTDNIGLSSFAIESIDRKKIQAVIYGVSNGSIGGQPIGFLATLSGNDGYIYISGSKVKAGFADTAQDAVHAFNADLAAIAEKAKSVLSDDFVSGFLGAGHKLVDGVLEVDKILVRQSFETYELAARKVTGIGGSFAVTDDMKILSVTGSNPYLCTYDTSGGTVPNYFQVDDIVRCQIYDTGKQKYYLARVTAVNGNGFTLTKIEGAGVPAVGDTLLRFDNYTNANRKGLIYITSSDSGAPYLDVTHGFYTNPTTKTKVRLGLLEGIYDTAFGGFLTGYGLYGDNVYLKNLTAIGRITVTAGSNVYTKPEVDSTVQTINDKIVLLDTQLANYASDGVLNGIAEKAPIKIAYDEAANEVEDLKTQAASLGVSSVDFNTAFQNLKTFVEPLLVNLTATTNVDGATLRNRFSSYGVQKSLLTKAMQAAQTSLSLTAQTSATQANTKIDSLKIGGSNLINRSRLAAGFINETNGTTITVYNNYRHDPTYYPCIGGEPFVFSVFPPSVSGADGTWISWYDASNNYLGKSATFWSTAYWYNNSYAVKFNAPANAAFYRYTLAHANIRAMLEKATIVSDYTESDIDIIARTAKLITISGATQIITVNKSGAVTPSAAFTINGTAQNTTITAWTYSVNGAAYSATLPTGVTRSGDVVTINPSTSTFKTLSVKATDGTNTDIFTIARAIDGQDGAGIAIKGTVATYSALPTTGRVAGDAYLVQADGLLYIFDGSAFPANGKGVAFKGDTGATGATGANGINGTNGVDGKNAIVGYLTNESVTLSATSDGTISDFTPANGAFKVFDGITQVSSGATYSVVNQTGCAVAINSSGAITVSAITADTASATLRAVYGGVTIDKVLSLSKSKTGVTGAAGASAPLLYLSSNAEVMTFAADNTPSPTSQTISFTANLQNTTGTATFSAIPYIGNTAQTAIVLGGTGNARTLTQSQWGATVDRIVVTATLGSLTDVITIVKLRQGATGATGAAGQDSYTLLLTNESHTFAGSETAAIAGSTTSQIISYKGATPLAPTSITVGALPTGMTASVNGTTITFNVTTAMVSANGVVPITIVLDGKTFTQNFSYAISFKGGKGDTGLQGVAGAKGADGVTYYTWVKYADSPTTGMSDIGTNKAYIGFAYNKTTATESTNYAEYNWTKIKGEDGSQGVAGVKGADGVTLYTWIKYSDNADGTGLYDVSNDNTKYLGIAVNKTTATESNIKTDYVWSKFRGDDGKAISSVDVEYSKTTSATIAPTAGWQTTAPTWQQGFYIWSRQKTVYSDNTSTTTQPVNLTGSVGNTGATGATGSTGANGTNGTNGTGVTSISEEFYLSTSKTAQVGGAWVSTPPAWESGKYIWTRSKIVYNNPTSTAYTTPIVSSEWEAVNDIRIGGVNLINKSRLLDGFINETNGTSISVYNNYRHDPTFYPCIGGEPFVFSVFPPSVSGADGTWISWYDASNNYLGKSATFWSTAYWYNNSYAVKFNAPANAAFYRYTLAHANIRAMLEKATIVSDYTESPIDVQEKITAAANTANAALANAAQAKDTADGKIKTFYQSTAPVTASEGDIWFDTANGNKIYTRRGTAWVNTQDSQIAAAINSAQTAKTVADGKANVYYQSTIPTGMTTADKADIWINTNDNNKMYVWSGTAWQLAQDYYTALAAATTAQATANSKNISFIGEAIPTATSSNDTWFDTTSKTWKKWNGTAWVAVANSFSGTEQYLKDALTSSTEITGGLILNSVIAVRNAGTVTAYTNGLNSNPIAFAAGVKNFGIAGSETQKIALKHDGSGFLASGNVSWDATGNVNIIGTVTATAGIIGGFQISGNKLYSNTISYGTPSLMLDASANSFKFYSGYITSNGQPNGSVIPDISISTSMGFGASGSVALGEIRFEGQFIDANRDATYIGGNGVFSNSSNTSFTSYTGVSSNASIVGLLRRGNTYGFDGSFGNRGIGAAVAGIDQTTATAYNSRTYGGYFNSGYIGGLNLGSLVYSSNIPFTLNRFTSSVIFASGSGGTTMYLPSDNRLEGMLVLIKNASGGNVTVSRSGTETLVLQNNNSGTSTTYANSGRAWWIRINNAWMEIQYNVG